MIESLYIASTGMHAHQTQIDVIANNLANLNTPSYKKNQVNFEDLMYQKAAGLQRAESADQSGVGRGAHITNTQKVFTGGELKQTNNPMDIAIRGDGFFEVVMPDGQYAYTRNGRFQVNRDGYLTTAQGYMLSNLLQVPADAQQILVKANGEVYASIAGENEPVEIGRLEVAQFNNASGLEGLGGNLYQPTRDSGDALLQSAGEYGAGTFAQGYQEGSNVELVEELTGMILAQRAYEVNSKVVQAADEMLAIANNLRR